MRKRSAIDLVNLVCGHQLGSGQYRTVFECRLNPDWVVKHDNQNNHSNIFELSMWQELQGTALGKWLAPVEWLSPCGYWLIQHRTQLIRPEELPAKVPAIFCDIKASNWGMLHGRPVCHDYGNNQLFTIARAYGGRLARAVWTKE